MKKDIATIKQQTVENNILLQKLCNYLCPDDSSLNFRKFSFLPLKTHNDLIEFNKNLEEENFKNEFVNY